MHAKDTLQMNAQTDNLETSYLPPAMSKWQTVKRTNQDIDGGHIAELNVLSGSLL